jgi:hypothetical protein
LINRGSSEQGTSKEGIFAKVAAIAAVLALIPAYIGLAASNHWFPFEVCSSNCGASPNPTAPASPTIPVANATMWLDQLNSASGLVSATTALPGAYPGGPSPLPHEIQIDSAQNGNVVTYVLGRKYKTLNLQCAAGATSQGVFTISFQVSLDGKFFPLTPGNSDTSISTLVQLQPPQTWIMPVSGVDKLQLIVSSSGPPLIVSGSLKN